MSIEDDQAELRGKYNKLVDQIQHHPEFEYIDRLFDRFDYVYNNSEDNQESDDQLKEILEEIDETLYDILDDL
ncbi:MAG: hypothetical protein EO766_12260 [Hydrotalea sp. AMD]|uniref:hypothetical protein n=1 Tax=Hydrotalea sp. AMD TaxID=2501297 RepID=UPI0010266C99|nr:hypothetical protein [Hydrotalea sp. AMD]RWZ87291.1 MAG: hypothetical protein EO766_12260 [Hydrotalea sp. AMD]